MRCSSKDRSDRSFSFSEATLQRQEWNTNQPHAFVDVMTLMSIRLWIADAVPNGEGQPQEDGGWMRAVGARGGRKSDRLNSQSIDDVNHVVLMLIFDSCFERKA